MLPIIFKELIRGDGMMYSQTVAEDIDFAPTEVPIPNIFSVPIPLFLTVEKCFT